MLWRSTGSEWRHSRLALACLAVVAFGNLFPPVKGKDIAFPY